MASSSFFLFYTTDGPADYSVGLCASSARGCAQAPTPAFGHPSSEGIMHFETPTGEPSCHERDGQHGGGRARAWAAATAAEAVAARAQRRATLRTAQADRGAAASVSLLGCWRACTQTSGGQGDDYGET